MPTILKENKFICRHQSMIYFLSRLADKMPTITKENKLVCRHQLMILFSFETCRQNVDYRVIQE
jgi:hypothetical protein